MHRIKILKGFYVPPRFQLRMFRSKADRSRTNANRNSQTSNSQSKKVENVAVLKQNSILAVERSAAELWKPALFTVGVCGVSFVGSCIWYYERRKFKFDSHYWGYRKRKVGDLRAHFNVTWHNMSEGTKAAVSIIAVNAAVLLCWRVKAFHPHMLRYFTSSYFGEKLYSPMILSVFSHHSLWHYGLNMYVLYTFAQPSIDGFLGLEQFASFYLSAGVVSSMAGHAFRALTKSRTYAHGASGAILAALMYTCAKIPDAQLAIIFLPFFTFSAGAAIYGILAFDTAGLVFGFRLFDHAAHLGGSLFGLWYAEYGEDYWKTYRPVVNGYWKRLTDSL